MALRNWHAASLTSDYPVGRIRSPKKNARLYGRAKVFLGDICLAAALHGTPWTSRVQGALSATSCRRGQARPYIGGP
jgi:hypothetical protein